MTDKDLRELDAWIAEHVMGWKLLNEHRDTWLTGDTREDGSPTYRGFRPTTDPANAMQVLEKCLSHPSYPPQITITRTGSGFGVVAHCDEFAETLPLAICLFAKALFEKEKPALKEQA